MKKWGVLFLAILFFFNRVSGFEIDYIEKMKDHYRNGDRLIVDTRRGGVRVASFKRKRIEREVPMAKKRIYPPYEEGANAITYSLMGRLGDSLVAYFHAKWLSYKYQIPFVYTPFRAGHLFNLSDIDVGVSRAQFDHHVVIKSEKEILPDARSTLYILPYVPECPFEYAMHNWGRFDFVHVDWEDPFFRGEMKRSLCPKPKLNTVTIPKGKVSIGVHVRRGGGIDAFQQYLDFPLKFPSDEYYIEQLRLLAKIFEDKALYIVLFTDDREPTAILDRFRKALRGKNVEFFCRTGKVGPFYNVLEDFFSMPKLDCLIMSKSNFSVIASKLKNYAVAVTPTHATLRDGHYVVDQVEYKFAPF